MNEPVTCGRCSEQVNPETHTREGCDANIRRRQQALSKLEPQLQAMIAHTEALKIHAKSLCAHSECLAMNAENCAVSQLGQGYDIPYRDGHYFEVMKKWKLIDENGEPIL